MEVRVKENKRVYIYGKLCKAGQHVRLEAYEGQNFEGKLRTFSVEDQFSPFAMEVVDEKDLPRVKKKMALLKPESIKEIAEKKIPKASNHFPEVKHVP